jgi:hypothetical protein
LHNRFVVGGYVRKRVTLRISKGLRAVALAAGISRRVYSDTRVIFITIIAIYIALAEKIGTPLITSLTRRSGHPISSWYQSSTVYSVSIHKSIPTIRFCFQSYPEKAYKKLGFLVLP